MPPTFLRPLASALALRRNVSLLLMMLVLVGLGEKLFQRFLPRYLVEVGAGPLAVGLLGFLENALGAIYALPGGILTDRLGHRRSLVLFAGLNLVGFALLTVQSWPAVLAAVFFCSAWSQFSLPATFSLVAQQLPKGKRVMGLAVQGIVRRIPMGLGPVIGGTIFTAVGILAGMRWVVLMAAVFTLLAVGLHARLYAPELVATPYKPLHPQRLWSTFPPELRRLLVSDILIRFCEQIPNAFVILWVINRMGRSDLEFGWLTAIEMATAASLYIPVAFWVDRRVQAVEDARDAKGSTPALLPVTERGPFIFTTFCFFTAFPLLLYFSTGWWPLVIAFVVRGLKEFGEPARKATIVDLAAEGLKARTVGFYYFLRDSTVAFAALLGGFLWKFHPGFTLWTAFAFGCLGTFVFAAMLRPARRTVPLKD
ncbi:MAG: MFS transporter [bacterium]